MGKIEDSAFIHLDLAQMNEKLTLISEYLKEIATQLKIQNEKDSK